MAMIFCGRYGAIYRKTNQPTNRPTNLPIAKAFYTVHFISQDSHQLCETWAWCILQWPVSNGFEFIVFLLLQILLYQGEKYQPILPLDEEMDSYISHEDEGKH